MVLPISPLSQRDHRWANQRLGTVNGVTIGSDGCIITDMAMLSTYYGHPILPDGLDNSLTDRDLYYDGDLFVNNSITKIFSDIVFDNVVFCESTPAPVEKIKTYLDAGKPSVVALINQGVRHYILVIGYEGDRIFANDPWQGDQVAINDRWGDPAVKILQINFFSGPVPIISPTHPSDGPHMDDGQPPIITTPPVQNPVNNPPPPIVVPHPPITVTVPPVDMNPINNALTQGLSDLQNTIAQLVISTNQNPVVAKTVNQIFIDSLKSRKFILSILASLIAFLNSKFKLGLNQEQLITVISPLMAFIGVEGIADIFSRTKTPPPVVQ